MTKKPTPNYELYAITAMVLFVAIALYIEVVGMPAYEVTIFRNIYELPLAWKQAMLLITMLGSSWMVIAATLVLFVSKKTRLAAYVLGVGITTYAVSEIGKYLVARPRPFVLLEGVVSREPFVSGMGFPSGHTAVATAVSLIILPYLPKAARWIVPVWIFLVAFSRVYLGVHAPFDVLGGFLLGVVVSQLFWLSKPAIRKWFKRLK